MIELGASNTEISDILLESFISKVEYSKWEPITIIELCNEYSLEAVSNFVEMMPAEKTTFMGGIALDIMERILNPKIYRQGNSGSSVESLLPSYTLGYDNGKYNHILKTNGSHQKNTDEFRVYEILKSLGLPVSEYILLDGTPEEFEKAKHIMEKEIGPGAGRIRPGDLLIENIGQKDIERIIHDQIIMGKQGKELVDFVYEIGQNLGEMIVKADVGFTKAMSKEHNIDLAKRAEDKLYRKFEDKFGVSRNFAENNYYLLEIIKSLPGADSKLIRDLMPIINLLEEAKEKYPTWTVDIKADNTRFTDGKFKITDFNYIRKASIMESDAVFYDSVIPIREALTQSFVMENPWNEEDKRYMISKNLEMRSKLTGKDIDGEDYTKYRAAVSFFTSLKNLRQSASKLANAKSYIEINKYVEYMFGYRNMMGIALQQAGYDMYKDPNHFMEPIKKIASIYSNARDKACPKPIIEGLGIILAHPFDGYMNLASDRKTIERLERELKENYNCERSGYISEVKVIPLNIQIKNEFRELISRIKPDYARKRA